MQKELDKTATQDGYTVCSGCGKHVPVPAEKIKRGRGNVACKSCKARTPVFARTVHTN